MLILGYNIAVVILILECYCNNNNVAILLLY